MRSDFVEHRLLQLLRVPHGPLPHLSDMCRNLKANAPSSSVTLCEQVRMMLVVVLLYQFSELLQVLVRHRPLLLDLAHIFNATTIIIF